MEAVNVHEAKTHFSKLIERVSRGEEITIARAGKPVAKLVPLPPKVDRRTPGSGRGIFLIGPDFDAPLPDDLLDAFSS
jgi:prevent-host-death family protein